jgi:hypothetical protein
MKKKIDKLYIVIPLVYGCFILLFLLFHFMNKEPFNNDPLGYLIISGSRVKGDLFRNDGITRLYADVGGFRLIFSDSKPVILILDDGRKLSFTVESYTLFEKSVEVRFKGGLTLTFRVSGEIGENISVFTKIAQQHKGMKELLISYGITGNKLEIAESIPVLSCRKAYDQFFCSLPHGSSIDPGKKVLILRPVVDDIFPVIILEKGVEQYQSPYLYWFHKYAVMISYNQYKEKRDAYLKKAYTAWLKVRYNREEGRWRGKNNETVFDENIARAILSEALIQDEEYRKVLSLVSDAVKKELNRSEGKVLPFKTAPYLGRLENVVNEYKRLDATMVKKVEQLMQEKNPSVFTMPELILFLLNRTNMFQFNNLIRLVQYIEKNVDFNTLDTDTCLSMVEVYYSVARWLPSNESYFSPFKRIINYRIFPQLVKTEEGVFLSEYGQIKGSSRIVLLQSIRAGYIFISVGTNTDNKNLISLGQKLILSALSLSDEDGFLPAEIFIGSDGKKVESGILTPESIYDYITEDKYTPVQIPLDPDIRPGTWLWTVAHFHAYVKTGSEARLALSFPRGESHYLFIQGIENIFSLILHDHEQEADEDYYKKRYGWYYDEHFEILYIKLNHLKEEEEIRIIFSSEV